MLQTLAQRHPLLLLLDDLQWADAGSISLLFHLGQRLTGHRILILGAYRPEDVALGRSGERHPLASVVNEFQREFGQTQVDLAKAEGCHFVDALLDAEPNRLGTTFRETLYRHTGGQALFTVELLRGLQERGDLLQDEAGQWVEGAALGWDELPARVEAVIAERIGRLPPAWQATLAAASVEGETFTAEVVARVRSVDEAEVIRCLSSVLGQQLGLVSAHGLLRLDEQSLSRYGFRHYLFQKYLSSRLDEVERARLHEAVGNALEALYGEQAGEIAILLARHFEAAGLAAKAVDYLLKAENRAVQLSANAEAIALLSRGLALLETRPESPARAERELALQLALSAPLLTLQGWGASEYAYACDRAYELCRQMGGTPQLFRALFVQADLSRARGEYQRSLGLGEQFHSLAQRAQDPQQIALAHWTVGETRFFRGEFLLARDRLEQTIALHDAQKDRSLISLTGPDMGVVCLSWASWLMWILGYPDQALARSRRALALAQGLDHPLSLGFALAFAGCGLHLLRREPRAVQGHIEALVPLVTGQDLVALQPWTLVYQGWSQAVGGGVEEGITQMRAGIDAWLAAGAVAGHSCQWQQQGRQVEARELLAEVYGWFSEGFATPDLTGARALLEALSC